MKAKSPVDYKKRSKPKKTAYEQKVGTTSGATQLSWAVAAASDGPAAPNAIVQVDRHLNLINRRLYRQNKVYSAKVRLSNPNETVSPIGVYVLRNTWAVRKALHMAKKVYDQAVSEERAQVGNARWQDFRINTISNAFTGADATLPYAVDENGDYNGISEGSNGEYNYSSVATTDANGVEQIKSFKLNAASSTTSYSVWAEFQNMGPRTQQSPQSASTGGYDRARGTDFEDANVAGLLGDGNQAPYNPEALGLTSPWVKVGEIGRESTGGMITSTPYFEAPLGVIVLYGYANNGGSIATLPQRTQMVEVCVKDGDYKGVSSYDI
jgi:hypothetical protein